MLGVFHISHDDLARGLTALEVAFEGAAKFESVRLEWDAPFLWMGINLGRVWAWCRIMPGLADAPDRLAAIDVPVSAFQPWHGEHPYHTVTIEIVDPELTVTRGVNAKVTVEIKKAKWPQFRIADRIIEAMPPRLDPERKSHRVSLGWLPLAALEGLLSGVCFGSDEALLALNKRNPFNIHLAFEENRTLAVCENPQGLSVAAVGFGTETQYELSIPFLAARAIARGTLCRHAGRGWAAVLMGMPQFKEWWTSFVAGEGNLRVGVSAPSGYEDSLQLLVFELPRIRLDTVVSAGDRSLRFVGHPEVWSKPKRRESACVKIVEKTEQVNILTAGHASSARGVVHGPSAERCVDHGLLLDALSGVGIESIGWFDTDGPDALWVKWASNTPPSEPSVVGLRSIPAGAIKGRRAAQKADFGVDLHPSSTGSPKLHVNDGLALDLLVYVDGLGSEVWRTLPEFREMMFEVDTCRKAWDRLQKMPAAERQGKNLWDIDKNAGIIQGSGGTKYVVLPDGEVTILADTADQAKLARARKFLHEG